MSAFNYIIRDQSGRSSSGVLEAPDVAAATATLRDRGALILKIAPATPAGRQSQDAATGDPSGHAKRTLTSIFTRKPGSSAIEVGLKQISILLRSGLTLLESLRSVTDQTPSGSLRRVLLQIADDVRAGRTLTESFKARRCFSRVVTQLCEIGEQTGQLELVLERAAEALERRRLLASQIISALLYPAVVFFAALGVTVFILLYAVPRITVYLRALGRPLPPMTQRLVDLSDFLVTQWPAIIGFLVLGTVLFAVSYSLPVGRLILDSLLLRVPLIGYILRTGATSTFSRSMSILLSSGLTIIEALRTVQEQHHNRRLTLTIAESREAVMAGDPLAPSYQRKGAFMPMLASMISAGERSGQLDQTLAECATFHEQRLTSLIRLLSSVVEILVVIVVGGIVGYVYIAFMMALYGASL